MINEEFVKNPEASETPNDPLLQGNSFEMENASDHEVIEPRLSHDYHRPRSHDPDSKRAPKSTTGQHPAIRATSLDDDELTFPVPSQDNPLEDTPGEIENPQNVEDEDLVEDAFDES